MKIVTINRVVTTVCTTQSGKIDTITRENKGIRVTDVREDEDVIGLHRAIIEAIHAESQNK